MSGPGDVSRPPPRPVYAVRLRRGPDCRVPDVVALRRLLKALARVYDLECVGAWEVSGGEAERETAELTR